MQVNILLFSTLKDMAGQNRLTLSVSQNATVGDVRRALIQTAPPIEAGLNNAIASVNREYAFDDDAVADGDEVAFFPPVSGGSDQSETHPEVFLLPAEQLNHDEIIAAITTPATGAVCVFSGAVRGETQKDGQVMQTDYLEYEAYAPMALEKMKQLATEIRQKWPLVLGIALVQRVGKLTVGESTVLIACSSAHRDQGCFEAARHGIDRLKEVVPVWKKEVSANGEVWVEGDYIPTPEDRAEHSD